MHIRVLLALISLFYLCSLMYTERARATLDGSDSWGYYVHLPASLLYQDVGDYSKTIAAWQVNYPNKSDPRKDAYGIRPTPTGKLAVKYPIGVALLESPFFLAAHLYCLAFETHLADGFSIPYAWAIALSSLFFAVLGLFLMYKNLRFYFSERKSIWATAAIGLGTNLFFFIAYTPGMSHPVAFCLIAGLILATRRWFDSPTNRHGIYVGVILGMIGLTRTQDLIVLVVPLMWGIKSFHDIPKQFRFFWKIRTSVFAAILAFLVVLIPQSIYWKMVSGQWWRYGYQGEQFDWSDPHIRQGLLSFENGWLIYTPIMFLALWGLFRLRNQVPDLAWPILVFLPLHWLISYSWWCWMYINGFGSRPMVDTYALMVLPLAAWIVRQARTWLYASIICLFIGLNLFQTWQTHKGIFWAERGSWAFYKEMFGRTIGSEKALSAFESREVQPMIPLKLVKTLTPQDIDPVPDSSLVKVADRDAVKSGEFSRTLKFTGDATRLFPGDWLLVSVPAFIPETKSSQGLDQLAKLVVDFSKGENQVLKYRSINIGTHIGNPNYILWRSRATGEWGTASFWVRVPMGFDSGSRLTTYVWNPNGQEIFTGAIKVELWQ